MSREKFICFQLGEEEFAIPLLNVKEVIGVPELTPIPQMPPHFLGIMNLRGNVITIIDLRTKLGLKGAKSNETAVMIVEYENLVLGCMVDKVNSVLDVEAQELIPPPSQEELGKSAPFLKLVIRKQDGLILVLDIGRALSLDDKTFVHQRSQRSAA